MGVKKTNPRQIKVLDTFAGAGGFSLGFQLAGFSIIGAIEVDKWAADTFRYNHPESKIIVEDIEKLKNKELEKQFRGEYEPDILLGGPPCQGFSHCLSKNAGDPKDPRNSLFREFIRCTEVLSPNIVIMENVPNLVKAKTKKKQIVLHVIQEELSKLGYHVYFRVLEATSFGIPQIRKRLFVIGSKNVLAKPFPDSTHFNYWTKERDLLSSHLKVCPSLWDAISDLPEIEAREGSEVMEYERPAVNDYQNTLRESSSSVFNHKAMNHSKRIVERFASLSSGQSVTDCPEHLRPYRRNSNGKETSTGYDQNNRRMHPDKPCHTIPASFYANFVHPYKNRNFTPREGARIQSFPDWYRFQGKPTVVSHKLLAREGRNDEKYLCQYNQIGNAVPPLLAKKIAENLMSQI